MSEKENNCSVAPACVHPYVASVFFSFHFHLFVLVAQGVSCYRSQSSMPLPPLLQRIRRRNWIRSHECHHLCCLILFLRTQRVLIPADLIATFFYGGELIGVVWSSTPGPAAVLEVFYASSNLCLLRFPLALPAHRNVEPFTVAWSPDAQYVVAMFDVLDGWPLRLLDRSYRLFLALFNVELESLVHVWAISGDSTFPHFCRYTDNVYNVAISSSPYKVACVIDGVLQLFAIEKDKLKSMELPPIPSISHVSFMANGKLACLVGDKEEVLCMQIVTVDVVTGTELSRTALFRLPEMYGKASYFSCTAESDISDRCSVVIAFHGTPLDRLSKLEAKTHIIYNFDWASKQTAKFVSKFAIAKLGTAFITSIYCTSNLVFIGTDTGRLHVASCRKHYVYTADRSDLILNMNADKLPYASTDGVIRLAMHVGDRIPCYFCTKTHGVMTWTQ